MDRDSRWERIKLAYDLICKGEGKKVSEFISEIKNQYKNDFTDEFLRPMVKVNRDGYPIFPIG